MAYTDDVCSELLGQDISAAQKAVQLAVTVPLSEGELVAYTDFTFNAGAARFRGSTMLRKLNSGAHARACNELPKWVCVASSAGTGDIVGPCANALRSQKSLPGLVKRRAAEQAMCLKGISK